VRRTPLALGAGDALATGETDLMVDAINTMAMLLTPAAGDARRDML